MDDYKDIDQKAINSYKNRYSALLDYTPKALLILGAFFGTFWATYSDKNEELRDQRELVENGGLDSLNIGHSRNEPSNNYFMDITDLLNTDMTPGTVRRDGTRVQESNIEKIIDSYNE